MNKPIEQKNKITPAQLAFMVIQTQVGVGILSLPHELQAEAKGGAWISVLAAGLVAQLVIILLWALARRFPQDTFYGVLTKLTGKWIGKGLGLIYVLFYLLIVVEMCVLFVDIIGRWVLIYTPRWITVLLGLITGMYLARESLRAVARFFTATTFLIVPLVVFNLLNYFDVNFYYIFPITEAGWFNILVKGAHKAFIAMLGFEVIMVLYPFVQGTSKAKLIAVSVGNLFVTLLYTFITFTCLVVFSPQELPLVPEPVVYQLKALSLQVIERIDLFFLSIWVVMVITSGVTYFYFATIGIQHLIPKKNIRRKSVPYLGAIIFLTFLVIQTPEQVQMLDNLISYLGYLFYFFIPLLLFLLSFILKNKVTKSS